MRKGLGYIRLPKKKIDSRDYLFSAQEVPKEIPPMFDDRANAGPVMDQENTNSCVGHAIASIADTNAIYNKKVFRMFSPLFAYWTARSFQNWTHLDKGAYIFDGVKGYATVGISPEKLHPFSVGVFSKPDIWAYSFSKFFTKKPDAYYKITDSNMDNSFVDDVKVALANGYKVIGGIRLPDDFYMPVGGVVRPTPTSKIRGGHALRFCGYVDLKEADYQLALAGQIGFETILDYASSYSTKQGFLMFKNSWGTDYGRNGYGLIPYDFVDDNGNDFWAVK